MTKQEKIKEVYGVFYKECNPDENGWTKWTAPERFSDLQFNAYKDLMRPLSLNRIEDNNGWIKIESENDLPKEDLDRFYIMDIPAHYSNSGMKTNIGSFKFGKNTMSQQENYFTIDNFFYHRYPFVTYYKPIEKPKPPIY